MVATVHLNPSEGDHTILIHPNEGGSPSPPGSNSRGGFKPLRELGCRARPAAFTREEKALETGNGNGGQQTLILHFTLFYSFYLFYNIFVSIVSKRG